MKNCIKRLLMFACGLLLISASCKKAKTGIEGLPAVTQEGKQTFGCMVNGVLFLPKGSGFGGPIKQSNYTPVDGTLLFILSARRSENDKTLGVNIAADGIELHTGMTIPLVAPGKGAASGTYTDYATPEFKDYRTNNQITGELKITRFDFANQIVSGTFWFDAVDENGQKVEVREGRFDMRFTK